MKNILKVGLVLFFVVQVFAARSQETLNKRPQYEGIVGLWTNVVVPAGESARGLFVLGGTAKIDGNVRENVLIIRGNVELNGEVGGNLVVVSGSGKIGDNAKVGGDIINVGSVISVSPKARIGGSKLEVLVGKILPDVGWVIDWIRHGALKMRLFAPQVKVCWGLALTGFILNLILVLVFPRTVSACMEAVRTRPVTSFAVGLLFSWIMIPLLLILLVLTGIGILVTPFFTIAVFVATMFGKAAVYRFVGHQVGAIGGKDVITSPVAALIVGSILVLLLYMLPLIGLIVWTAVTTLAFGAAIVAAVVGLRGEMPSKKLPPQVQPPGAGMQIGQPPQYPTVEQARVQPESQPATTQAAGGGGESQDSSTQMRQGQAVAQVPSQVEHREPPRGIDYRLQPRVGFWRRFLATLIDFCVFIIPIAIFHGFAWVLWFVYHFLLWKWTGATVGDMVVGIKIVKEDGSELDWKTAIIRALGGILSTIALGIGFFWAGWSRDKKAWHDYIAGTIVVRNPR